MTRAFGVGLAWCATGKSVGTRAMAAAIAALLAGAVAAPASAAGPPAKLSQIFAPNMLESKLASFEQVAGKASKIVPGPGGNTERRFYKIEGCEVEAAFGVGLVRSLYLKLSDRCTFELAAFFAAAQPLPTASKLTFGEVERALGTGPIVGVCLLPCRHAHRPAVYEHLEGSQADKFVDAVLEVGLVDDVSKRAASAWTKPAREGGGRDYLKGDRFNCDRRYDDMAHKLFDKVRITAIRIGYNFTEAWQCD